MRFGVVGPKELTFWHPADITKRISQKGTFGKAQQCNLTCLSFDEEGWCYTGGDNGLIQVWSNDCTVVKSVKAHAHTVTALATEGNKLISGSKDQKVAIISIAAGGNFKLEKLIDISGIESLASLPLNTPKSVDFFKGNLLIGLRNGSILQLKNALESEQKEPTVIVQSHFEGEAWGLTELNDNTIITVCDDNRVMMFDTNEKKFVRGGKISAKSAMKDPARKSLAASASKMSPNKQGRCVAASAKHNHLVVCSNLGKVSIRSLEDFDKKITSLKDAKQWC